MITNKLIISEPVKINVIYSCQREVEQFCIWVIFQICNVLYLYKCYSRFWISILKNPSTCWLSNSFLHCCTHNCWFNFAIPSSPILLTFTVLQYLAEISIVPEGKKYIQNFPLDANQSTLARTLPTLCVY